MLLKINRGIMKYLIGNLKMNMDEKQLIPYLKGLKKQAKRYNNIVGVAVPFPYLYLVKKYLGKTKIWYGSQNVNENDKGAYTGEVALNMLKDFDVDFSIVGHSERRAYYNETDASVNAKIKKLLEEKITPIFCFGENLAQREKNEQNKVVQKQITQALKDIDVDDIGSIIFAYEPIWAIGTGVSATSAQAEKMAKHVKDFIVKKFDIERGKIRVLYGGSLNDKNADELLSKDNIDGGLIGGASLKVETFEKIFSFNK